MRVQAATWADTKDRDNDQCARCSTRYSLTHQHRRAVGMGGSPTPPSIVDSLTLCFDCNGRCERDLQTIALAYGWKVRRWVGDPGRVPVFYPHLHGWARLTKGGEALRIHATEAAQMMREVYGPEWDQWCAEAGVRTPERK
ncbi:MULTISPECIES: hypothetical protein [unclassified Leucobacter]|uniref:hypothetical protein n=1 Tax=unclassified Leucobacter TaxID=2621730 RepID=UPI000621D9E3|nr:hypothetical protein [Leucobacter sp. Ag1]KKI16395.1 hypothetical protein XM48_16535 [Leucobacter sp. Ag1]